MDNIANEENINTEKIINLIKKNLKKEHFRSHNDIIKFLDNKKIPLSQSRISYYLNKYNIHKNKLGYYEDFSANVRESLLKDILLKSNAHIYKPRVYGLNIDSTTKKNDLFFIFIKMDSGNENFLCELLSDYFPNKFSYLAGYGCVQIFINSEKNINVLYKKLNSIKKM